jgi:hypothetical protein
MAAAALVVATHVALIFLINGRSTRHMAAGVVDITFFPLPITPDSRLSEPAAVPAVEPAAPPTASDKQPTVPATAPASPSESVATVSAESEEAERRALEAQTSEPDVTEPAPPRSPDDPASSVDWQAELSSAASTMEQRGRAANERRSFSHPSPQSSMTPRRAKRPCPFEECEPGWDAAPSVFDSKRSKKGRIEKAPDEEVIRWISNNCYEILITPNPMHRAMTRCVQPLGKGAANGHLFDRMRDVPLPQDRATDVP